MNQGTGASRDDDDLPLVDVVVPDDARELFRDVLAYHRELRALRHRERMSRVLAPFRRRGAVLPLATGLLLFALLAGVTLSMLSTGPFAAGGTSATASVTAAADARLPAGTITVGGQPVALSALSGVALTLVPAGCDCRGQLIRVITQAAQARLPLYLVSPAGQRAQLLTLTQLARDNGQGWAFAAEDQAGVISKAYRAVVLTVLLVDSKGALTAQLLRPGFTLEPAFAALRGSG